MKIILKTHCTNVVDAEIFNLRYPRFVRGQEYLGLWMHLVISACGD